MARIAERTTIYEAAERWKERCLLRDGSIFGAASLWTSEHISGLIRHFVENPDEGNQSFEEKLKKQLEVVSQEATQLAAEMLWVMMLFPSNITKARKVELVRTVWGWSGHPLADPDGELDALSTGIGSGGMGYNSHRPFELHLLIRFAEAWKALEPTESATLSTDPWAFAAWFDQLPDASSRQIRHMLLYLLFPDEFERISSKSSKQQLERAFSNELEGVELDLAERGQSLLARDRRLFRIRRILESKHPGAALDYYSTPELAARWRPVAANQTAATDDGSEGDNSEQNSTHPPDQRAWVIGAGEGAVRWPAFLELGHVAIGWDELGDLSLFETRAAFHAAMKNTYVSEQDPFNDSLACYQFCREISVGDEVYAKQGHGRILGHGIVEGAYEYDESRPDYRNIRRVKWIHRGNWILPETIQVPVKTLTEVTGYDAFLAYMGEQLGDAPPVKDAPAPYTVDDVMRDSFISRDSVEAILGSLKRRKNLILQGPPGVGKSFLARRIAYALIGVKALDRVQTVQFHQSYAYEDFIQGWRPSGDGGFGLRNGVFFEFCRRAQSYPDEPHVFIIDEVNRGNLSKVFGELLMLIEADKRGKDFAIPLTYSESSTDTFYVPDNLYIIGLMNTADRSLAMVDYALRRRFAFRTLRPEFDSPAFERSLLEHGVDEPMIEQIIERIGKVNAEIEGDHKNLGPGFAIGHSYFCPDGQVSDAKKWYRAVIHDEIEPLLTEYWFDDVKRVEHCLAILEA